MPTPPVAFGPLNGLASVGLPGAKLAPGAKQVFKSGGLGSPGNVQYDPKNACTANCRSSCTRSYPGTSRIIRSKYSPYPPRTTVRPCPNGSYANPTRGPKSFLSGERRRSRTLLNHTHGCLGGWVMSAHASCEESVPVAFVSYSQRSPRFK